MIKNILFSFHKFQYRIYNLKSWYISRILKSCGSNLKFWGPNISIKNPQNLEIGNNVSINDNAYINAMGNIIIGDFVSISANSIIVSTGLTAGTEKVHASKPIVIGNNVHIGVGAIILAGVTIGDNIIIGAGSVVTKDVENNSIIVGNPAKILRTFVPKKEDAGHVG